MGCSRAIVIRKKYVRFAMNKQKVDFVVEECFPVVAHKEVKDFYVA